MFSRRTDLALDRDPLSRFLPWLVAFMVFLAILALAGALALHHGIDRWSRGMEGTLTVQLPPASDSGTGRRDVDAVVERLRSTPGVTNAEEIPASGIAALLEPWLGDPDLIGALPLPRLIDVRLADDAAIDADALATDLRGVVPGAVVDDHRVWLDRLVRLVRTVEGLASAVLVLIGLATIGTVVFATRSGLAIHREAIEVLHLIGAQDSYVARQFAGRALRTGLRGGIIGLALAAPTLWAIVHLASRLKGGPLTEMTLDVGSWVLLGAVPLVVAAIATVTARITVIRALARML